MNIPIESTVIFPINLNLKPKSSPRLCLNLTSYRKARPHRQYMYCVVGLKMVHPGVGFIDKKKIQHPFESGNVAQNIPNTFPTSRTRGI